MLRTLRPTLGLTGSLGLTLVLLAGGCGSSSGDDDDSTHGAGTGGTSSGTAGMGTNGGSAGNSSGGNGTGGSGAGSGGDGGSSAGPATGGAGAVAGQGSGGNGRGGTGGAGGSGASGGTGAFGGISSSAPDVSPFIVVDQFGYLPDMEKIAVLRDPQTGADADQSFTPGATYALVDASSGEQVLTAAPTVWNGGNEDPSSGDKAWWFDFSTITKPGAYYVLDIDNDVRSYAFDISPSVYADVLRQALRMLFYQRVGQEKTAETAGKGWADGASHVGPGQDHAARLFNDKDNAETERDLWGGWYDAGDLNKYTSWTAGYVENLLRAYAEKPSAFGDDYGIPESGNGIPDVLDEAKWGLEFLTRMQEPDGSLLSIVGEASASPPSSATGQSLYGSPNTSATLATAAAFAYGALVLGEQSGLAAFADDLGMRAEQAWSWADANPNVLFKNNDSASGSSGLGSGQQETDDYGRTAFKLDAAVQLFRLTGDATYQSFVDDNYDTAHLVAYSNYVSEWDVALQDALLEYSNAEGATANVASAIRDAYDLGLAGGGNLTAVLGNQDPYLAWMKDYVWGSNQTKAAKGNCFTAAVVHAVHPEFDADLSRAASRYIHYIHGLNPLSLVYLSNMNEHGAENSVNEFYHSWFKDGSADWDRVGTSTYGPPPGYLVGGPNPSYDWDGCCPSGCGSSENNALCSSQSISPPKGQPPQKSYKDFNAEWPLDSWSISEPSDGYQIGYIRLLSKFVDLDGP